MHEIFWNHFISLKNFSKMGQSILRWILWIFVSLKITLALNEIFSVFKDLSNMTIANQVWDIISMLWMCKNRLEKIIEMIIDWFFPLYLKVFDSKIT